MKQSKTIFFSLLTSVGVFLYIVAISFVMNHADKIFGKAPNFWGPVAFLLLFVLSAIVVGALVLGWPIHLFLVAGRRLEAILLLLYTIFWIFIEIIVILVWRLFS